MHQKKPKSQKQCLNKRVIVYFWWIVLAVVECIGTYASEVLRHHQTKQRCLAAQEVPRNHLNVAEFNRSPFHSALVHRWASITELCRWFAESDCTTDMRVAPPNMPPRPPPPPLLGCADRWFSTVQMWSREEIWNLCKPGETSPTCVRH